jgi:hypothetical protein
MTATTATVRIVGVRHHSPACARLVRSIIAETHPHAVLIEGPSDMNERLGELALPHTLPVAVYSYCAPTPAAAAIAAGEDALPSGGSWSPFCDYSPEWVALRDGLAAGATVRFIDLPAWDRAFFHVENRYSDHDVLVGRSIDALAVARGFDSTDSLWDHLFEESRDPATLERDLAAYFAGLRGPATDDADFERDRLREAYMERWIRFTLATAPGDATVLVVCGGFHKPALEARLSTPRAEREESEPLREPEVPAPDAARARVGSYLVPFSFERLDAFAGYASGMPSPAYYQARWERGEAAGEELLFAAIGRLRARGQRVSTADAIAVSQLAEGLSRLRGHRAPNRSDVLDALAGALVKDALDQPVPWSTRAPLSPRTDPYVAEIVHAFRGDRRGTLADGTPRPPLTADIERECARHGIEWTPTPATIIVDVQDSAAVSKRQTLYRLLWLQVPGVEITGAADLRRGKSKRTEQWRVARSDRAEAAVIERALYGATLEAAALARLTSELREADGVAAIVDHLRRALLAGFLDLGDSLEARAEAAASRETSFASCGVALFTLAGLQASRGVGGVPVTVFGPLFQAIVERALWLLEAIEGSTAPLDKADVNGVLALRASLELDLPDLSLLASMCVGVWSRRLAASVAPPALRGACLGALWTFVPRPGVAIGPPLGAREAADVLRGIPTLALGDFLGGLFALAREAFLESDLLALVDERLAELGETDFLVALPALRRAFAFFPPRERRLIATRLLERAESSGAPAPTESLLAAVAEPAVLARARELEQRWFATAAHYGLLAEPP